MIVISLTPFYDKVQITKEDTIQVLRELKEKNFTQADLDEVIIQL